MSRAADLFRPGQRVGEHSAADDRIPQQNLLRGELTREVGSRADRAPPLQAAVSASPFPQPRPVEEPNHYGITWTPESIRAVIAEYSPKGITARQGQRLAGCLFGEFKIDSDFYFDHSVPRDGA